MVILAEICDNWATGDTIRAAAQRVGISTLGLDVNKMQQDKFEQAANCMEQEQESFEVESTPKKHVTRSAQKREAKYTGPTTPRSQSKIAKNQTSI